MRFGRSGATSAAEPTASSVDRVVRRTSWGLALITLALIALLMTGVGVVTAAVALRTADEQVDRTLKQAADVRLAALEAQAEELPPVTPTLGATGSPEETATDDDSGGGDDNSGSDDSGSGSDNSGSGSDNSGSGSDNSGNGNGGDDDKTPKPTRTPRPSATPEPTATIASAATFAPRHSDSAISTTGRLNPRTPSSSCCRRPARCCRIRSGSRSSGCRISRPSPLPLPPGKTGELSHRMARG
jgi:hypothetical protein